jgi:Domain of unknown function (DUF1877)
MGMTCTLWRVSEADRKRLADLPGPEIEMFLFGERITPQPAKGGGLLGWLKRLSPITIEETPPTPADPADRPKTQARGQIDLDKAWQGLHFLFTGTASEGDEPGCFLLRGGADLGEDEIGNDIPRVISTEQVQQFAAFLSALSAKELKRRFDPDRMMELEIYPEIWDRDDERHGPLTDLVEAFDELREFVRTAADEGELVVILIT